MHSYIIDPRLFSFHPKDVLKSFNVSIQTTGTNTSGLMHVCMYEDTLSTLFPLCLTRYVFLRDGSQSAIAEFPPPASPRLPEALFSMDESAPTVPLNLILASSPTTTVFWQKINVRQLTTNKMLGNSNAIRNSLYVFSRLKRETTIPVLLSA